MADETVTTPATTETSTAPATNPTTESTSALGASPEQIKPNGEQTSALGGEHKGTEDGKDTPKEGDKGKEQANKAPENYEAFKLLDGQEMDQEALAKFIPVAKELNLTQEQAQKIVSIQAEMVAQQAKQWSTTIGQWLTDAKADKEFGGLKWDENLAMANKAIDTFGTPALRELFNSLGVGNHPEMIRFATRVGRALGEGSVRNSGHDSGDKKRVADVLYGTPTS